MRTRLALFMLMIASTSMAGIPKNQGTDFAPGFALGPVASDSVQVLKNDEVLATFYGPWENEVLVRLADGTELHAQEKLDLNGGVAFYRLTDYEFVVGYVDPTARSTKRSVTYYFKFFEITGEQNRVTAGRIITTRDGEALFDRYGVKKN